MGVFIITWASYSAEGLTEGHLEIREQYACVEAQEAIKLYLALLEKTQVTSWVDDFCIDRAKVIKGEKYEVRNATDLVSLRKCVILPETE